jgi:hypothetical protein
MVANFAGAGLGRASDGLNAVVAGLVTILSDYR